MNTKVWGGPLWRVLHGAGTLEATGNPRFLESLATVVRTLEFIMPCSFCRNSYIQFAKTLKINAIEATLLEKDFSLWLYNMHNKVVQKLQGQALDTAGGPAAYRSKVFNATKLPWDVLQKRLLITKPYFSEHDVFTVLGILTLSAVQEGCVKRKGHMLDFATGIAVLLTGFPALQELGVAMWETLQNVTPSNFNQRMPRLLVGLELKRRPTSSDCRKRTQVLGYAKAGACVAGACL